MKQTNKKIELLAPVGNFEKLEIAIHYGADAVYLGGKEFSLRNFSGNFTIAELEKALKLGWSELSRSSKPKLSTEDTSISFVLNCSRAF